MSRIKFPEGFNEQKVLFTSIKSKHDADGASSVLTPILTKRGINLTNDLTAINSAALYNTNQEQYYLDAEYNRQQRDLRVDVVFFGTRGAVQFLKSYYKCELNTLGEWGIHIDGEDKVVYPQDFTSLVTLMFKIKAKHDSFPGTTSPLRPFLTEHSIDLNIAATALTAALTFNTNFQKNRSDAEEAIQLRNNLRNPVVKHMHDIGDYLIKLYKGSEQKLREWGFIIEYSPREPKLRTSTVKPLAKINVESIVLYSTFTNIGEVELHIYKGTKAVGAPVIVQPNETLPMGKGYSRITVFNPSNCKFGKFTALKNS